MIDGTGRGGRILDRALIVKLTYMIAR